MESWAVRGVLATVMFGLGAVAGSAQQVPRAEAPAAVSSDRGVAPRPSAVAARRMGAVEVDGWLDEAAWGSATPTAGFVQQRPDQGAPASERTEVRVVVDDEAIYVGARLHDREPGEVVARLGRRDDDVHADWFYVYLDSHLDRRTAFGFGVSAAGVQRDLRVVEDDREDPSWDAVWSAAVRRDADGWVAELRIPLSQLRFNTSGAAAWGLNFARTIARRNETSHWSAVPQGTASFVSLFGELHGIAGLEPRARVEVVPYTLARVTRAPGEPADPFHDATDPFASVGADVRVGLGSALTLSASLNPDFGQVEGDPAVLNLSAFEIFQEERRPFFVEGADIFGLTFPQWPPAFYSRRVGRTPQGPNPAEAAFADRPAATTILGAVKLSGKTESGWSIGLLDAVTPEERVRFVDAEGTPGEAVIEPWTNYAVARVARELRGGRTGIGVLATAVDRRIDDARLAFLHDGAYLLAADGYHRFGGAYELELGVLGSHVRGDSTALLRTQTAPGHYFQRPDADHLTLEPSRTSLSGVSAHARLARIDGSWKWGLFGSATTPGYEVADLGFNPDLDHVQGNAWLRYEDFSPGRVFRSWNVGSMLMAQSDTDGRLLEWTQDLGFHFELLNFWRGGVWVMRHASAWAPHHLRGGPALRKPGRWMGSVDFGSDRRKALSANGFVFWEVEDDTDGGQLNASTTLTVRPSEHMSLGVGPSLGVGREAWQHVGARDLGGSKGWVVGGLDRRTVGLTTRLDYTMSSTLSLQLYARPFLAKVAYDELREVVSPGAREPEERFRTWSLERLERAGADLLRVDRDGDGRTDLEMSDPSFAFASAQVNAVLRWEYRPGSTVFAVWSHDRDVFGRDRYSLGSNLADLRDAPARNVFMFKLSYWVGR